MDDESSDVDAPKPRRRVKRKKRRDVEREAPPTPAREASPRTIRAAVTLAGGATLIGIALVGTHESVAGAFLVIGGMLTLIGSIHKLGRLGPDTSGTRRTQSTAGTPRGASSAGQSQRGAA